MKGRLSWLVVVVPIALVAACARDVVVSYHPAADVAVPTVGEAAVSKLFASSSSSLVRPSDPECPVSSASPK